VTLDIFRTQDAPLLISHADSRGTIAFSHANGFPAGTYRLLFEAWRAAGYTVIAIDKFAHDPAHSVSNNWPRLREQLLLFIERHAPGERVHLVGHSLGGFLSLMCAARHPELAQGVLLLDSPLLGGWKAKALRAAKSTPLVGSLSPGAVSRKRKNSWPSRDAALEHFRHKKAFAQWDPQVLADYIAHGTQDDDAGQRVLGFDRDIETRIYNTLPDNMDALLKRHPFRCPVAFIGGLQSDEVRQVGMAMTNRITEGRVTMLAGSHLFPREKPIATAAAIEAALLAL
jgi:pimeloyl-ACP methyl ester carboxylesterase